MPHYKKIFVTGGAGFIGRRLIGLLLERGYEVVVYDNLSRGHANVVKEIGANLIVGDIRSLDSLIHAMSGCDTVVHLAAYGSVVESIADPVDNFSQNVLGTFTVLDAARRSSIKKFVFSSTGGALIGDATPPVNEESAPHPISPYGASKLCGEGYISAFAGAYDMDTIALRFGNVYGPGSAHKKGAITVWAKALLAGEPLVIYGDGNASRDFLYVDDLCDGIIRGLEVNAPKGNVFHLASGKETTVKNLAKLMCRVAGKPEYPIEFRKARKGEVTRNFAEYEKAKQMFCFEPNISLEQGMRKTWEWFKELPAKELNAKKIRK